LLGKNRRTAGRIGEGVVFAPDLSQINGRLGKRHVERFHRVRHDLRHRQIAFFSRERCRTIWLRRVTWRRSACLASSAIHTSGKKALA
jgi:hypothetical protein